MILKNAQQDVSLETQFTKPNLIASVNQRYDGWKTQCAKIWFFII